LVHHQTHHSASIIAKHGLYPCLNFGQSLQKVFFISGPG
jgi:hypothetical protein